MDVIVKRYQAWGLDKGITANVHVLRDGQKLAFEEAAASAEV